MMKKVKEEVEKKGLKFSVTENGEEGKNKMIASCRFLENELSQFSKEEGVTLAKQCGNAWSGLEKRGSRCWERKKKREEKRAN